MKTTQRQIELIDRQIKRINASGNYYSMVYQNAGITGVSSYEEFLKIPFKFNMSEFSSA